MNSRLLTTTLSISAMVLTIGLSSLIVTQPAKAQTAKNVICKGCINGKDIANSAIGSSKIKNGAVRNADLHSSAKASGTEFALNVTKSSIGGSEVISSIKIKAPSAGYVTVNASGWLDFYSGASVVNCVITTAPVLEGTLFVTSGASGGDDARIPFGATNAFFVNAGNNTFYFVCGTVGNVHVQNTNLVGVFVPNRY